jgi:lysozyme family protein
MKSFMNRRRMLASLAAGLVALAVTTSATAQTPSTFHRWLDLELAFEGGLVDDPDDPGGRTNKGITQRTYDDWRKRRGLSARDVADIANDEVEAIYHERWLSVGADKLPEQIAIVAADAAVHHGAVQAIRFLERSVGHAKVDGRLDPDLIVAARTADPVKVAKSILDQRREFCAELIKKRPVLAKYTGWAVRFDKLEKVISY